MNNPVYGNCYMFNSGWNKSRPLKKTSHSGRTHGASVGYYLERNSTNLPIVLQFLQFMGVFHNSIVVCLNTKVDVTLHISSHLRNYLIDNTSLFST